MRRGLPLILLTALAYTTILTTAKFNFFFTEPYGLVFNSMLEHMLAGRFDVDPAIVGNEGYLRNGLTYSYWGIFCALLRLPLLLIPNGLRLDVTILSCCVAASLAAAAKIHLVFWLARTIPHPPRILLACLLAYFLAAGPLVANLQPSIYSEPIFWAYALAAIFVFLAVQGLVLADFSTARLAGLGACAGLVLLARSSTGAGLYLALAVLLLARLPTAWRRRDPAAILLPAVIALVAILVTLAVNTFRWGSPFTGQDLSGYVFLHKETNGIAVLARHGMFSLARILLALQYYFAPLGLLQGDNGHLLLGQTDPDLFYITELPVSSLLLTDLLPILLGLLLLRELLGRVPPYPRWTTLLLVAGLLAPAGIVLLYWALTNRYRIEFAPAFDAVAALAIAVPAIQRRLTAAPRLLLAATLISIGATALTLFLYRLSYFGDAQRLLHDGMRGFYQSRYRNLARSLGIDLPFSRPR